MVRPGIRQRRQIRGGRGRTAAERALRGDAQGGTGVAGGTQPARCRADGQRTARYLVGSAVRAWRAQLGQAAPCRHRGTGRRGTGRLRRRAGQPCRAGAAVGHRLPGHDAASGAGRGGGAGADGARRRQAWLGRARGCGRGGRVLRELRPLWRPGRGRLRFQLCGPRAARARRGRGLQRRRPDPGRLGHLAGRQAAGRTAATPAGKVRPGRRRKAARRTGSRAGAPPAAGAPPSPRSSRRTPDGCLRPR